MNYVKVTHSKLSVEELSNMVASPRCGAISLFVGTTRDSFQEHKVLQLEYEAHEPMAVKAMSDICGEVRKKWPSVEHIAIYHRLGIVPVQEASVVIAVSSPHRVESLEAVGYTIEALKSSVTIWKKEVYDSDKPAEWKENKESPPKSVMSEASSPPDLDPLAHIEFTAINSKLVQVKADDQEIQRRMLRFIERKREDLNVINNREFCNHGPVSEEENSCARVDALVFRKNDTKSHLRIRRVFNRQGPQTTDKEDESSVKPSGSEHVTIDVKPPENPISCTTTAIQERLKNAEQHLKIDGPLSKDVYARLQKIEERILYLEGISPEYASFWGSRGMQNSENPENLKPKRKKTYTLEDLETKIQEYKRQLVS